jgi:hypothetical protein
VEFHASDADVVEVFCRVVQCDQKVSVHLLITIQKVTWLNLTAWQPTVRARGTLGSH